MKAFLMYKDSDFDVQKQLPSNEQILTQDLELPTLFSAMAGEDKFIYEVVKKAVLSSMQDVPAILYRQAILNDCVNNSAIVRQLYNIAVESIVNEKKLHWGYSRYLPAILHSSINVLEMFVGMLKKLRTIADRHADKFQSEGFSTLFQMLKKELSDEYFGCVQEHLSELKFREGVLISAELGNGNKGVNYVLRRANQKPKGMLKRIFSKKPQTYTFYIHERDESGARALSDLRERGISLVTTALAHSTEHILNFFSMLRTELAFYIGCLNLHEELARLGEPVCFPRPVACEERRHSFQGLYDICLALSMKRKVVGNDANADNKDIVIITGANQGGKSTFLRSIGLAQLMMQCGMYVPAEMFCANVCKAVFTHYKRKEDASMKSGKLDEELSRMNDIVNLLTRDAIVLFNESFAATNEREGSEIARQIISALLGKNIKVFFVTHLYDFSNSFYNRGMKNAMFLRAERQEDGIRTFKLTEGRPLQTSYGEDLYKMIFETENVVQSRSA